KQNSLRAFVSELKCICLFWTSCMLTELNKRLQAYAKLSHKFGFLHNVLHLDAKQLKDGADNLVQQYPNDLELEPSLAEELVHFRGYFKGKNVPRKEDALDDLR
ncbi:Hypothetical predicted protein, partial [Paramuricea clavata]